MYLTQGLHRSAQHAPNSVALADQSRSRTFSEVVDRVSRLATGMLTLDAQPGDRVGLLSDNSIEFVELALAVPWAGLVLSPINVRWSKSEIAHQLDDAEIDLLVVDAEWFVLLGDILTARPHLHLVVVGRSGDELPPRAVHFEDLISSSLPMEDRRGPTATMAVLAYTGGTTGAAKGVMLTHGQIATSSFGVIGSNPRDAHAQTFLHAGPLYHLAALGALYTQVALGSTHVVIGRYSIGELVAAIQVHEVTATTLVPTMVQRLLGHIEETGERVPSLAALGYGAAPIGEAVLREAERLLPNVGLSQRYGMTELGPIATILSPEDHRNLGRPERLKSAGRAALHTELRIVDDRDETVATGDVGEILVRGANVMSGYWRLPAETAKVLRGGWMHTGDMGYLDDEGYLYVVDRLKDMIVSGGENVYSTEVEKVLALHPAVRECAVIGVPDSEWGEHVRAVVVLHPGTSLTLEEAREFCCDRIARYKAPRSLSIVTALPVSAVGKVLKRELRLDYKPDL